MITIPQFAPGNIAFVDVKTGRLSQAGHVHLRDMWRRLGGIEALSNIDLEALIDAINSGLTDGDKGDITISGGTWNIDAGVVTTTELGGDITTAGKALLDDANAAAQRTTLGLGTAALEAVAYFATAVALGLVTARVAELEVNHVREVSTSQALTIADETVIATVSGLTLSLPDAALMAEGKDITVILGVAGTVDIVPYAGQTILGV